MSREDNISLFAELHRVELELERKREAEQQAELMQHLANTLREVEMARRFAERAREARRAADEGRRAADEAKRRETEAVIALCRKFYRWATVNGLELDEPGGGRAGRAGSLLMFRPVIKRRPRDSA